MIVRAALKDDYEAVLELMSYLNPEDPKVSESLSESIFNEIVNSAYFRITVAELESIIVGTCYLNVIPNLTRRASPYAVIENVVTHPNYRRLGVGNALMTDVLKLAESEGCYKVMLLTGRDEKVQTFYQSCGMKSGTKTAFTVRFDT